MSLYFELWREVKCATFSCSEGSFFGNSLILSIFLSIVISTEYIRLSTDRSILLCAMFYQMTTILDTMGFNRTMNNDEPLKKNWLNYMGYEHITDLQY